MYHYRFAFVVICAFSLTANRAAAISYLLNGIVTQINTDSGDQSYEFFLSLYNLHPSASGDAVLELVSPTGSRFGEINPARDNVGITLSEIAPDSLNGLVSGAWLIEETLSSGNFNRYQFVVPPLLNSPNFSPVPIITSPANGAIVAKEFEVKYTNPLPGSFGSRMIYADPTFQGNFPTRQTISPGHVILSFADIPGIGGATISQYSVNSQVTDTNALNPIPLNFSANARFDELNLLDGWLSYNTRSPAISFTIVPEPSTAVFVCVGLSLIAFRRPVSLSSNSDK